MRATWLRKEYRILSTRPCLCVTRWSKMEICSAFRIPQTVRLWKRYFQRRCWCAIVHYVIFVRHNVVHMLLIIICLTPCSARKTKHCFTVLGRVQSVANSRNRRNMEEITTNFKHWKHLNPHWKLSFLLPDAHEAMNPQILIA